MHNHYPKQHEIWIADLEPSTGSEPGKVRPVVIIQSNALNKAGHNSIIICPVSSQEKEGISLLRIQVEATSHNGLLKESFILCDQLRAIDLSRLESKTGMLDDETIVKLNYSIRAILTLY